MDAGSLGSDSTQVTLYPSGSTTETFTVGTGSGDAGDYTVTVSSDDDSDSTSVTVEEPPEPNFQVSITGTTVPVEGETLSVTADIENTGDALGEQTVSLDIESLGTDSASVQLADGELTTETFSVETNVGDAGAYTAAVSSNDDSSSVPVNVEEAYPDFVVGITGTNSPVAEGETLSVTASIENQGFVSGEQTVSLDAGSLGTDSASVQLDVGESTTETFTVGTGSGDAGDYTVTVSSDDDSDSTSVTVEEPPEPNFQVSITGTTVPVEGETLSVTADIENQGFVSGEQTVSLDAGSLGTDSASVQLADGELTTETFSVETNVGDAGTYTATVSSNDDSSTFLVDVEEAYPDFVVGITGTNSPVAEGETLSVTASIENQGFVSGEQTVSLDAGSLGTDSASVQLNVGESTTETFTVGTKPGDVGNYTVTVSSDDDSDSTSVTVEEPPEPNFQVSITGTTVPVEGETLSVTAEINNTGDALGEQTVSLDIESLGTDSASVQLADGESTTETFSVETNVGDEGTYTATVSSNDDSNSVSVFVEEAYPDFVVGITGTNAPVAEGETLSVTASIENQGYVSGEQTVSLDAGSLGNDSASVQLNVGESTTETFTVGTEPGDVGYYTVTVSSDDDSDSTSVTVEEPPEPNFQVSITGTTVPVEGETLSVTAEINNTGDALGEQTVSLDIESLGTDSASVQLADGESTTETFSVETNVGDAGFYMATVSSNNDSSSAFVNVETAYPDFVVGITGTNSPVAEGETLSVTASIENQGFVSGEQTVSLDAGSLGTDSASVQLNVGESTTETFTVGTGSGNVGNYTVMMSSDDDQATEDVRVVEPPDFQVSITGTTVPVEGETLSVTAEINNTGDALGEQTVSLDAGSLGTDSASVQLADGESTTETFSVETDVGDEGTYTATVSSNDDSNSVSVFVEEAYPDFVVGITGTNAPVAEGETLSVTASIENQGSVSGEQAVSLDAGNLGNDSASVQLDVGESTTETFTVGTEPGDVGNYTVTVSSDDDNESTSVTIGPAPYFAVSIVGMNSPVAEGETLNVTASIENQGEALGEQTVSLDAKSLGTDVKSVSLDPGESTNKTFTVGTEPGDDGSYVSEVISDDDSATTLLTVEETYSEFTVNITGTNSPVREGETLSVEAEIANIGNTGTGTTQVLMDAGPLGTDTKSVNVSGGSSEVHTFSIGTESGDAGVYSITIQGTEYGGNATTSIPVLTDDSSLMSLESADAPYDIPIDDPLEVEYTVKNIGSGAGDDSVQLSLDKVGLVDSEQVTLGPGNSTNGTLVFDDVEANYNSDELIDWTVTTSSSGVIKSGVTGLLEVLDVDISTPKNPVAGKQVYFYPQTNVDHSEPSTATWEFGNNETATQDFLDAVGTTYNQPGQYNVSVAVDAKGQTATDSATVTVQNDFDVTLNYSPASPATDKNVTFDIGTDIASDAVESVEITYGDGTGDSFDSVPDGVTHTYDEVGSYEVAVVVTGENGGTAGDAVSFGVDEIDNIDIVTSTDPPYLIGESVTFGLDGDTQYITGVEWEFGNGDAEFGYGSADTTYQEPGTYQVNATVTVDYLGTTTYNLATSVEVIERPLIRDISINPDVVLSVGSKPIDIEVLADRGTSVESLVVEGPSGTLELERNGVGVVDGNTYGKYTETITGEELYQDGRVGNVELDFVLENSETAPHTQRSSVLLMEVAGALQWAQDLDVVPSVSTGDKLTKSLIDQERSLGGPFNLEFNASLFTQFKIDNATEEPDISLSAGASANGKVQYGTQAGVLKFRSQFTSAPPSDGVDEFIIEVTGEYQPISVEYEPPIPISPTVDVSVGIGVRGSGTYTDLPTLDEWRPDETNLTLYVKPKGNVELLGDIPAGGVEISTEGEVGLNAPLRLSDPYANARITVTAKLGFWERSGSIEWSLNSADTLQRVTSSDDQWAIQDKYSNSSPADDLENEAIHPLTGDRLQDTNPSIAAQGDSYLVTWSRQNPQRAVTDGRDIYWSILEPGSQNAFTVDDADIETSGTASWTEPAPITNDTNFNAEPDIAVSDDGQRALAVWTRAQGDLETIDSPYDLTGGYDIALATYQNDSWSDPVPVTDNDMYTTSPKAAYRDGQWLVTWHETANVTRTEDPRVRFVVYNGTLSSPVTVPGALKPAVGATDDAFTLGYLNVDDGESVNGTVVLQRELPTSGDTPVFETVSTTPATQVTGLSVDNGSVVWVDRAGGSNQVRLADADSVSVVPTNDEQSRIDELDLAVGTNQTIVTYETDDARLNGTRLSYSAAHDGEWVATRNITGASNLSFSGAESAVDDGTIRSVFLGTSQADQYPDLFGINHSFLPDLETTATVASPDDPIEPGQNLTIDYTVENIGEVASGGLQVTVSQGDQQRSSSEYAGLAVGETATGTVTVPVDTTEETFTVDATLLNGQQHRTANSVQDLTADIQLPEPELDIASVEESRTGDTYQVEATVDNLGIAPAQNVSTLLVYADQIVETTDISVPVGKTTTVTFTANVTAVESYETGTVEIHGTGAPVTEPITGAQPDIQFEGVNLTDNGSAVTAMLGNSGLAGASVPVRVSQAGQTIGTGQANLPASNGTATELVQVTVPVDLSADGRTVGVVAERANSTRAPHDVATISEVPTVFQAQFPDQAVSKQTEATVRNVDTNGTPAVVMMTYRHDGDETVAGVTTGTFAGENVTVTLGTNIGFPDQYTVYVAAAGSPAASYEPGDMLPANVTSEIPVYRSARVTTFTNAPDIVVVNDPAKDTTGDGLLNDVNGDGSFNIFDIQVLFSTMDTDKIQNNAEYFNFQGSNPDEVTIFDVQVLFSQYAS